MSQTTSTNNSTTSRAERVAAKLDSRLRAAIEREIAPSPTNQLASTDLADCFQIEFDERVSQCPLIDIMADLGFRLADGCEPGDPNPQYAACWRDAKYNPATRRQAWLKLGGGGYRPWGSADLPPAPITFKRWLEIGAGFIFNTDGVAIERFAKKYGSRLEGGELATEILARVGGSKVDHHRAAIAQAQYLVFLLACQPLWQSQRREAA